jgi:hypothetical protein
MSPPEQPAENSTNENSEASDKQSEGSKNIESGWVAIFFGSRLSKLRALAYSGIAAFFWLWGAFFYNNHRIPPSIPIFLIFVGGVFGALAAKQIILNHGKHTGSVPFIF